MAKFYLTSGEVEFVVTAVDAEGAALWVINQFIGEAVSLEDETETSDYALIDYMESLDQFGEQIMVSQIGFGREEVGLLETEWMFMHWFQLSSALDQLLDQTDQSQ